MKTNRHKQFYDNVFEIFYNARHKKVYTLNLIRELPLTGTWKTSKIQEILLKCFSAVCHSD